MKPLSFFHLFKNTNFFILTHLLVFVILENKSFSQQPDSILHIFCIPTSISSVSDPIQRSYITAYNPTGSIRYSVSRSKDVFDPIWNLEDSTKCLYDSLNRKIYEEKTSYRWGYSPVYRAWYDYDSLNRVARSRRETHDGAIWKLNYDIRNFYNSNNFIDSVLDTVLVPNGNTYGITSDSLSKNRIKTNWIWDGSTFAPSSRITTYWNIWDDDSLILTQSYDTSWKNVSLKEISSDSLHRQLSVIQSTWDTITASFIASQIQINDYSNSGFSTHTDLGYVNNSWDTLYFRIDSIDPSNRVFYTKKVYYNSGSPSDSLFERSYFDSNGNLVHLNVIGDRYENDYYYYYNNLQQLVQTTTSYFSAQTGLSGNTCYYFRYFDDSLIVMTPDTVKQCSGATSYIKCYAINPLEGMSYNWSPNLFISNTSRLNFSVNPSTSLTYQLEAVDSISSDTAYFQLVVQVDEAPINQQIDSIIPIHPCYPDTLIYFPAKQPGYDYYWRSLSGTYQTSGDTLYFNTLNTANQYYLIAISQRQCPFYSDTITLQLPHTPSEYLSTIPNSYCYGDTINLIYGDTTYPYTYQWKVNNIDSVGANSQEFACVIDGIYTISVTDTLTSCTSSRSVSLIFGNRINNLQLSASPNGVFCSQTTDSVWITPSHHSNLFQYRWYMNDTLQPAFNNFDSIKVTRQGHYSLQMQQDLCKSNSDTVWITVDNFNGGIQFVNDHVCPPDSALLVASPASSFLWSTGDTTQTIYVFNSGNYSVQLTDSLGCTIKDSSDAIVYSPAFYPVLSIYLNMILSDYLGNQVWYLNDTVLNGITQPFYIPQVSGNYTVSFTDNNGCEVFSQPIYFLVTNTEAIEVSIPIIYPNPFSDFILISNQQEISFELFDITGTRVMNMTHHKGIINTSTLNPGIYFIKLTDGSNHYQTRLIKQE